MSNISNIQLSFRTKNYISRILDQRINEKAVSMKLFTDSLGILYFISQTFTIFQPKFKDLGGLNQKKKSKVPNGDWNLRFSELGKKIDFLNTNHDFSL